MIVLMEEVLQVIAHADDNQGLLSCHSYGFCYTIITLLILAIAHH